MENIFAVSIVLFFTVIISGFVFSTHYTMQKDGTELYRQYNKEPANYEQSISSLDCVTTKDDSQKMDSIKVDDRRKIKFGMLQIDSPDPRIGGSATIQDDSGFLFLTGGFGAPRDDSDVHILSTSEMTWEHEKGNIDSLSFCSSVLMDCRLFIFGGIDKESKLNDRLLEYDFDKKSWQPVTYRNMGGQLPDARFNGTLSLIDANSAILFGGRSKDGCCLNDIWILQLHDDTSLSWTKIMSSSSIYDDDWILKCRESHFSVCVNDKVFIIGGCGHNGAADIISPGTIGVIECSDDGKDWNLSEEETSGENPKNLIGGSAHVLGDTGKIIVVSGENTGFLNAIYTLDTRSVPMQWESLALDFRGDLASVPGLRLFAATCLDTPSGLLYLFGGHSGDGEPQEGICVVDCVSLLDSPDSEPSSEPTSPLNSFGHHFYPEPSSAAISPVASTKRRFNRVGLDGGNKNNKQNNSPDKEASDYTEFSKNEPSLPESTQNASSDLDDVLGNPSEVAEDNDPSMPELIVKCYDSFRGAYLYRTANVGNGYSSFGLLGACSDGDPLSSTGRFDHFGPLEDVYGFNIDGQGSDGDVDEELGPLPPLIYKSRSGSA